MLKLEIKEITASLTWPLRQSVMYPEYSLEYVVLEKDFEGKHFGGYIEEELVCVVSLFINTNIAQFRKLATLEKHQNKGIGSKMLNHIFNYSKEKNCTKIWCNARVNKAAFYHKFGLKETNKTYVESDIKFVIMEGSL